MIYKRIFSSFIAFALSTFAMAQLTESTNDWKSKDINADKTPGISLDLTYTKMIGDKKGKEIVVAVIDSGVDVEHEDLQGKIWINQGEVAGNGIDDDNNGYIDDIHGWNFIGGASGNVQYDNLEFTRIYKGLKDQFDGKSKDQVSSNEKEDYARYVKMKDQFNKRLDDAKNNYNEYLLIQKFFNLANKTLKDVLGGKEFTVENIQALPQGDEQFEAMKGIAIAGIEENLSVQLDDAIKHFRNSKNYSYNLNIDSREIVGDDYNDLKNRFYGNNSYQGPSADHGTHVAGIIAANRNNGIGANGVANNAKIMVLRVVPDGDERDKDVANAIRYAADNGAKVINMSFGKSYSPQKVYVDEAVQYASEKGVLLIHAAGNSSKNNDKSNNFPNPVNEETRELCPTWIEVGASNFRTGLELPADFTNYGAKSVDVFAPGVDIYSTVPDNEYKKFSGTSMAAPVVAGLAALIWSYYPELTAVDVKNIVVNSYGDYKKVKVMVPHNSEKGKKKKFKKLSRTGGIVNALNAFRMADQYQKSSS